MKYIILTVFASLMLISNPAKTKNISNPSQDTESILTSMTVNAPVVSYKPSATKNVIKLTIRHFPIARLFAEDDDDDDLSVAQHYMLHRRDFVIETVANVDTDISDSVKLRLFLIRHRVLEKYKQTWA